MIEIIGYVDVEETPVRWNAKGDMFMTADFRWHKGTADIDATGQPIGEPPVDIDTEGDHPELSREDVIFASYGVKAKLEFPRTCAKCGSHISYVGRGRPRKYCGEC